MVIKLQVPYSEGNIGIDEQLLGHYENTASHIYSIKETIKIKKNGLQHQLNKFCC
jgi:hypothetical protein